MLEFANAAAWQRFREADEADALLADIRFQGEDRIVKARSEPGLLTPEDFRLLPGSGGQQAGPDGDQLGANIELVGPGDAYQRWKETAAYPQWHSQTRQRLDGIDHHGTLDD